MSLLGHAGQKKVEPGGAWRKYLGLGGRDVHSSAVSSTGPRVSLRAQVEEGRDGQTPSQPLMSLCGPGQVT